MRKFIVSDLHGNGEVYDSIMAFLDRIAETEEVELYINGDLIDYGFQSFDMIMDVFERTKGKGNIKIHYLGGNHELMMYQALKNRKKGEMIDDQSDWLSHDGSAIEGALCELGDSYDDVCDTLRDFSGSLGVLHVFDEKILHKPILLVHGQAPLNVSAVQTMKMKDDNQAIIDCVWNCEFEYGVFGIPMGKNRVGNDQYFTIVGHRPVLDSKGFHYYQTEDDAFFRIDGGCHPYVTGNLSCDHVPLVEVKDDYLSILVFNHNNEITQGYYFDGEVVPMKEESLQKQRSFLNPAFDGNGKENKQMILELKKDGAL